MIWFCAICFKLAFNIYMIFFQNLVWIPCPNFIQYLYNCSLSLFIREEPYYGLSELQNALIVKSSGYGCYLIRWKHFSVIMIMNCVTGNWFLNSLEFWKPLIPFSTWIKCSCWLDCLHGGQLCPAAESIWSERGPRPRVSVPVRRPCCIHTVALPLGFLPGVPQSQIFGLGTCISFSNTKLLSKRLKFSPFLQSLEKTAMQSWNTKSLFPYIFILYEIN